MCPMILKKQKPSHIDEFREGIKKAKNISRDAFFTWFDGGENTDAAFIKGSWDFASHIAEPLFLHVESPHNKTILEIGYGGGRVLLAASRYFKKAVGVDIHTCDDMVSKELKARGALNVTLHKTDGKTIPLSESSVDVVYSFIVFQHLERIEMFKQYINETYRVLKQNGIAVIYFGRFCPLSHNKSCLFWYCLDRMLERIFLRKGWREIPTKANYINLIVRMDYAKKIAKAAGFSIMHELVSHQRSDQSKNKGKAMYGLQYGLVLKKN